ncbi:MAG: hypothetical protein HZA08_12545 [Nitrospirae bacterium]|nr:hypothetical protein [Nitrospirota bacterium]
MTKRTTWKLFRPLNLFILCLMTAVFLINIPNGDAFELNGFTDVSFTKSEKGGPAELRNGNFAFGTLDLYLAQTLEDTEVLVELIVEDGDILDLERVSVGYTFSDEFRIRAGRFHTPLGFWNTSYHHGVQLQPTIKRPEILKFEDEGGMIPAHMIGAYFSGRAGSFAGPIEYGVLIGNGPRITDYENRGKNSLVPNNTEDNNIGKAIAFHAAISPEAIEGLKVGFSGHISRVQTDSKALDANKDGTVDNPVDVDQTILAAAVKYTLGNIDLSGEYFSIKNKNHGGMTDTNNAYYGLATYSINDRFIPYLMYDKVLVDHDNPYSKSLGTQDTVNLTAGVRYNINYRSSIKGELRNIDMSGDDWNEYAVQWSLAF